MDIIFVGTNHIKNYKKSSEKKIIESLITFKWYMFRTLTSRNERKRKPTLVYILKILEEILPFI